MNSQSYEICVFGLGFVGLTTALSFAEKNYKVVGIDTNQNLLNELKNGSVPFNEPYLQNKLKKNLNKKNLSLSNKIKFSKKKKYIIFICVGTPVDNQSEYNLTSIKKVIKYINLNANSDCYLYLKSTVLPGTTEMIKKKLIINKKIEICSNPEFLREGKAWLDFNNADKIVVGYDNKIFLKISKIIYKNFKGELLLVNPATAEFIKQTSNAMLSNMISFSNNLALLAEKFKKIDIKKTFEAIHLDKRFFGYPAQISSYIYPGLGFGGYCLPKDIQALSNFSKKYKKYYFFKNIIKVNNDIFQHHLKKILSKTNKKSKIFILGLSFKEGTDDIRQSKTINLTDELLKRNYRDIILCDKLASEELKELYTNSKAVKVFVKPFYKKNSIYVIGSTEKYYLNFLKKIPNKQIIDTKYSQ